MSEKTIPNFRVGQVVVMAGVKAQTPFRILEMLYEDGWFYAWSKKNFAAESMLRELKPEEL